MVIIISGDEVKTTRNVYVPFTDNSIDSIKYICSRKGRSLILKHIATYRVDNMATHVNSTHLINPYVAGDPVGKTFCFVGRKDILRAVERVIYHPSQNAITLYGQRRIGKTSILQYLASHLPEIGDYRPIFIDLMHKSELPIDELVRDLASTIAGELGIADPGLSDPPQETFRSHFLPKVLAMLPSTASLILLLDEFDALADPQAERQLKQSFFSYLRDLRQFDPQRLKFIFVLGRNINDLDVVAHGLYRQRVLLDAAYKRLPTDFDIQSARRAVYSRIGAIKEAQGELEPIRCSAIFGVPGHHTSRWPSRWQRSILYHVCCLTTHSISISFCCMHRSWLQNNVS
jgi:hypothetical protein